jgi:hypothetical protein
MVVYFYKVLKSIFPDLGDIYKPYVLDVAF